MSTIGLLPDACSHTFGSSQPHDQHGCHASKLPGKSHVRLSFIYRPLTRYRPKALVTIGLVSSSDVLSSESILILSLCSGLCCHRLCFLFAVDCISHVRLPCVAVIFPALMAAVRIAIWNRNRFIVTITVVVWLANLSFLIFSKSVLLMSGT